MPDPVYRFMFDIGASLYVLSGGSCPFPGQNDALSQRTFNPLPISHSQRQRTRVKICPAPGDLENALGICESNS
jgi:hypothetical protein